ncbi:MAG: alpha/beta fold hydrolase [Omnitrophica WOR_2 bacterium]
MTQANYAKVNGLNLYYEVHGTGKPLVLLHGGFGTTTMFGEVLPLLAEGRQVIPVELQAHGHTADIDRPLSFEMMADDIAALVRSLGFEKVDLMGYSLGGGVALQAAIRHPELVRKLVVVSAPYQRNGWYPEVLAGMAAINAEGMVGSPMHAAYMSSAPRPENFTVLADKTRFLLGQDYDWSSGVASIRSPTLIVVGDADSVRTAHAVQFFELLGGGKQDGGWDGSGMSGARLAILPGTTHYQIFSSPALAAVVIPFLEEPLRGE